MNKLLVVAAVGLVLTAPACAAADLALPALPVPAPGPPLMSAGVPSLPETGTSSVLMQDRLPGGLQAGLPLSMPADLLREGLSTLPGTAVTVPAVPATMPCRFVTSQLPVAFGVVPLQADVSTSWRDLELLVVCDRASSFVISTQPAAIGDAALSSGMPVQIRRADDTLVTAHVSLDSEGRPLASRVFSLPAQSPTRIPVRAALQAAPGVPLTPAVPGQLQQVDLAGSLFLRLASEADQLVYP